MKKILFAAALFVSITASAGSWYYNIHGGFGIYEPLGWRIEERGRSVRLHGPERDSEQSLIFIGSDWIDEATDLKALENYLRKNFPEIQFKPAQIKDLKGFAFVSGVSGMKYIFRSPQNVILIGHSLKGSPDQIDEGELALSSISISTKAIAR